MNHRGRIDLVKNVMKRVHIHRRTNARPVQAVPPAPDRATRREFPLPLRRLDDAPATNPFAPVNKRRFAIIFSPDPNAFNQKKEYTHTGQKDKTASISPYCKRRSAARGHTPVPTTML